MIEEKVKIEKKKMNGFLKFLIVIVIIALIIYSLLRIFLPELFAPRDLGVKVSQSAYNSTIEKLKFEVDEIIDLDEYDNYIHTYGKPNRINDTFTSEEITSFINLSVNPLFSNKNIQVKFSNNGIIEVSGTVNVDEALKSIEGLPEKYKKKENLPVDFIIPDDVNMYIKASGSIKNNVFDSLSIYEITAIGIDIMPYIEGNDINNIVSKYLNKIIENYNELTYFYAENITIENGKMHFIGDFPSSHNITKK